MKRVKVIHGFTLLEVLTSLAIVAILIGLLIPAIGTIKNTAQGVKQKAQFHAIELALQAFQTDTGDYPSSDYTITTGTQSNSTGYCGAQKLAEALVGMDGFGFHPKSLWRSDGLADMDNDGTIDDSVYHATTNMPFETSDENLKVRKGPYLELERANAVKLYDLYPPASSLFTMVEDNTYVLTDMFGVLKNRSTGRAAGMPILYFRADEGRRFWKPDPLDSFPWGTGTLGNPANGWDSIYSVNDNFPFFEAPLPINNQGHPMSDRTVFYDRIKNPNYPGTQANNFKDARPYRSQTFILLSAGADGLYGTSDDVYNVESNEK